MALSRRKVILGVIFAATCLYIVIVPYRTFTRLAQRRLNAEAEKDDDEQTFQMRRGKNSWVRKDHKEDDDDDDDKEDDGHRRPSKKSPNDDEDSVRKNGGGRRMESNNDSKGGSSKPNFADDVDDDNDEKPDDEEDDDDNNDGKDNDSDQGMDQKGGQPATEQDEEPDSEHEGKPQGKHDAEDDEQHDEGEDKNKAEEDEDNGNENKSRRDNGAVGAEQENNNKNGQQKGEKGGENAEEKSGLKRRKAQNRCVVAEVRKLQLEYATSRTEEFQLPIAGRRLPSALREVLGPISRQTIIVDVGTGRGRDIAELAPAFCESMIQRRTSPRSSSQVDDEEAPTDEDPSCPTIHMIEPSTAFHVGLSEWAVRNGYPPANVHLWKTALGTKDGSAVSLSNGARAQSLQAKAGIMAKRLDTFLRENSLDALTLGLLRVDAGPNTPLILEGASGLLQSVHARILVFKYSPNQWGLRFLNTTVDFLKDTGYDCFLVGEKEILKISSPFWAPEYASLLNTPVLIFAAPVTSSIEKSLLSNFNTAIPYCQS